MAKANQVSIPYLDPSVQHVGISRLRAFNVTQLADLDRTLVIQDNDKPLAVLVKYGNFMAMQEAAMKWELKLVKYDTKDLRFINDFLKAEGEDGFELVQVVGDVYYYKRQKVA
jgi:hypothetical protein